MTSLLDLSPVGEEVEIDGKKLLVRGLSLAEILRLIGRFPHLRALFEGREPDWNVLFETIADAVGPIIAASVGRLGDAEYERAAEALPTEHAWTLLEKIKELTMPGGAGPFVARVRNLLQQNDAGPSSPSKG